MSLAIEDMSYADCGLLLAILLASTYVYNKGSFLPKSDPFHDLFFETPQKQIGAGSASLHVTRDFGERTQGSAARFIILWGSQSGTAESLANRLGRDIQQRLGSTTIVGDLSDYDPATLANLPDSVFVVLVMSTYGEGDPSDNAQEFVSYLTTSTSRNLTHVPFAAFGCGNSSYRYFNKVIQDVSLGMEHCGAKLMLPIGTGDEATRSTHEDFLEWKEKLISLLASQYNLSDQKAEYRPSFDITINEPSSKMALDDSIGDHFLGENEIRVPIISRQIAAHYEGQRRTCIDLKLDISCHAQIKYRTGDHIAIWPWNSTDEVGRLLRVLGREHQRNHCLRIRSTDELIGLKVPSSATLDVLFSQYLDICAPVSRETVLSLSQLAPNIDLQKELEQIGGSRESYANFLDSHHVTLARLLERTASDSPDHSWATLPLSFLIDSIPAMQPRLYSISSSSIVQPRQVGIVVSVKTGSVAKSPETEIHGVASTHLSTTEIMTQTALPGIQNDRRLLRAEIRRSSFKLPFNLKTPVIMVAAGTGIAPFRAFIQERARLTSIGRDVGSMVLFFGCQNESDCLFYDELADLASKHSPAFSLRIVTAFSRPQHHDPDTPFQRMYVQDRVLEHRKEVLRYMLEEDASLYICGATAMAKAVGDILVETVMERRQLPADAATQWRQERRRSDRWHEDVWS